MWLNPKQYLASARTWIGARVPRRAKIESGPALVALTPKYDVTKHAAYFDMIQQALSNDEIRNIALTGGYGVGKSSILAEVTKRHKRKVISISLSTLGFEDKGVSEPGTDSKLKDPDVSKTNQIQKEIIKQILYSQDPERMPGSRYRRVTGFRFWRELGLAGLLSVPITLIFLVAGWTAKVSTALPFGPLNPPFSNLTVLGTSLLLLFGLRFVFHNRLHIGKITAGGATIELSARTATYFDEYLDEIVYFFEVTKRDIVIFEDIDRFEDAHIFETLRALNTILNGAKQLRGRSIRFIYAIKDSIFDELGERAAQEETGDSLEESERRPSLREDAADAEVARANRTKFFDVVIPVVPFITHRSARDLVAQTLKGVDSQISTELVDLTARYVADMRLIKNIRNEFVVFKQQILNTGTLELSQDQLFAMMLYKSIHLSDFEKIRFGTSDLDELYRAYLQLVEARIDDIDASLRQSRRDFRGVTPKVGQGERLGAKLTEYVSRVMTQLGVSATSYVFKNQGIQLAFLQSDEFWDSLAATDTPLQVTYQTNYGYQQSLTISRADISQIVSDPLTTEGWRMSKQGELTEKIGQLSSQRVLLSDANMERLIEREEFTLERGGVAQSMKGMATSILESELAVALVTGGYVDRNFTLYTSTFHGERVSVNAMNFMINHVDRKVMNIHFKLSSADVQSIIRERGTNMLAEKGAYNVSILNYLLTANSEHVGLLTSELKRFGEDESTLLLTYMEEGSQRERLIRLLGVDWKQTLVFVVSEAGLDENLTSQLVNAFLQVATAAVDYEVNDAVSDYLTTHYSEFDSFRSTKTTEAQAASFISLLERAEIDLPLLAGASKNILFAVVQARRYVLSRANLLTALGEPSHSVALDAIAKSSPDVYARVCEDFSGYLSELEAADQTVEEANDFPTVIQHVLKWSSSQLSEVIERAAPSAIIEELERVPVDAWSTLVRHQRFRMTFRNVQDYINKLGLDADLASALAKTRQIEGLEGVAEADKQEVALQIIEARITLPDPSLRAELAAALSLEDYVPSLKVTSESGRLVGHLVNSHVVQDDAAPFQLIPADDFAGREFAISCSPKFATFMSASEVPPTQVGRLLSSKLVPETIKEGIALRFSELTEGSPQSELVLAASYLVSHGIGLEYSGVARLAIEGVDPSIVVALLQPHLAASSLAELIPVLTALGGEYLDLTVRNGKRPRLPKSSSNLVLADRLIELEVASSRTERRGQIQVNMRKSN